MKAKSTLRHFLALAGSSLLAISSASATIVNWDGDTSATWATAANWDTAPTSSLTADIANFNLPSYDGVTVFAPTVGTATSINGITIGALNAAMTLTNTAALSIGASGITIANGAGAFTISGSTTLGAAQSWTNNSANLFTFGAVSNGANLLTLGGSGNMTASGVIGNGAGGLIKNNAGTLTLNAANTYTGATTVNGGELRWGVANALNAGALNINNGGTVNIQDKNDTVGTITLAQGGSITGSTGILTTAGFVSNNGGSVSGFTTGALNLNGTSSITYNDTIVGSTTLSINRVYLTSAPTFNIARGDDASGIDLDITDVLYTDNNGRNIIKTGDGVMRLSGSTASTGNGTGTMTIQNGTLIYNKTAEVNACNQSGLITIGDGIGSSNSAVLRYETSNNQIANNPITINSDGLFDLNGKSETISGALTVNGGSLTTGAGTLFLGGTTNTISGASTVTGNLTFNRSSGNANILVLGGTASINGTTTFTGDGNTGITATGNTAIEGTLAFGTANRSIAVTNASDTLAISANTTGSGAITKTGTGSLVLTGSNGYSGATVVNAGTLQIGDGTTAGTMASASALTIGNAIFRVLAPASGSSSQTVASLATSASTGSTIRLTPGASGNTTLTITSNTLSTGSGSSVNFDYTAGTTVGGTVGNNYVVWNPTLTDGIIGAAYTVTDSGGTGFATTSGGNVVRLTDPGGAGLPDIAGSATGSYFIGSGYSTNTTTTPGSLVLALSGAVAASNVTVNTSGLASGANLALGTNLLTLGVGMVFNGPNPYEITGSGAGGLQAASAGGTINLYNANTSTVTISAPIVNNSASRLTIDGAGTTILSGTNTYTGATVLNGGTTRFSGTMAASAVTINNNAVAQLGTATALTSSNSVTFGAGSTGSLQLLGNSVTIGALSSNATPGAPVITNNNGGGAVADVTLTIDSASSTTFGGVIQDGAGGGALSLTKTGSGTLTLSGSNTYSGGTVINGGTVTMSALDASNLGGTGANITFNGTGTLQGSYGGAYSFGSIAINGTATLAGGSGPINYMTFTGPVTGSGTLNFSSAANGYSTTLNFNSTANTFTGPIIYVGNANNGNDTINVNSLGDGVGAGSIQIGANNRPGSQIFAYGSSAIAPLTLNYRQIVMGGTTCGTTVRNNNTTQAITINTDLGIGGVGNKALTLDAVAGPTNTWAGKIQDGTGSVISVTKSGVGTWALSGANTYTGGTTVGNSAGTLIFLNTAAKPGTGTHSFGTSTTLGLGVGGSGYFSATDVTNAFTGTMSGNLSGITVTTSTNVGVDTTAGDFIYGDSVAATTKGLTKLGNNILTLTGTNSYTGATTVNGGTLELGVDDCLANNTAVTIGAATLKVATNVNDTVGTLDPSAAATINLGSGATLAFAASNGVSWAGGTLNLTGTFVSGSSLRFGTTNAGLTAGQLLQISATGWTGFGLDASGYLTATPTGGDVTPPTLANSAIVDDKSGGPVAVGTLVTYTVTFSEDMDAGTVSAADFGNAGSAAVTIGSVSETSPGVFTVQATPTSTGTLQLRVNAGAALTDTSANPLDTTSAIADDTIITVQSLYDAWSGGAGFDADANGDGVDNGLAFLLGAANKDVSALGLLPTVSQSGGNLVMTFKCRKDAYRGSALLNVEHSSNLGISDAWLGAPVTDAGSPLNNVSFSVSSFSTELNSVTATISSSEAASGKLFGRLKGTNP